MKDERQFFVRNVINITVTIVWIEMRNGKSEVFDTNRTHFQMKIDEMKQMNETLKNNGNMEGKGSVMKNGVL